MILLESCKPDYAISGPLVVSDEALTASSESDVAHNASAARLRPVNPSLFPLCWKPLTSDTAQWIEVSPNTQTLYGIHPHYRLLYVQGLIASPYHDFFLTSEF